MFLIIKKIKDNLLVFSYSIFLGCYRVFFTKLLFVPTGREELRKLLKVFLLADHNVRQVAIAKIAMPLGNGVHPKNIFNYRSEFFKEHVNKEDVVIDLGCGTGAILQRVAPIIKKGYGVDYSSSNLGICTSSGEGGNVEFIKADILSIDYGSLKTKVKYTTAFFSHILEHVKDPVDLLKKVGADKVLICVPSQENWLARLKINLGLSYLSDPTHYREYSRDMLRNELAAAGYNNITYIGFNSEGEIICSAGKK